MPITAHDDGPVYEDPVSHGQMTLIEQLLDSSCFDEEQRKWFKLGLKDISQDEVQQIIDYLLENQLDPVTERGNHSSTEAKRRIKKLTK